MARTAGLTGQSNIPCHGTPCPIYKLQGVGQKPPVTGQKQARHWSAGDEQLHCAPLFSVRCYSSLSLLLTTIIISSISIVILLCFNHETALSQPTSFLSSHCSWGRASEQLHSTVLPGGIKPQ